MKSYLNKIILIFALGFLSFSNFSYAETITNKKVATDTKVEISFPVERDDFLLFYGVTQDEYTNTEINKLRKDFIEKFESLKEEYKDSLYEVIAEKTLSPISEVVKKDTKAQVKSPSVSVKQVKKEELNKDQVTINPIVNIIDNQSIIHTENPSWFQKIKSIFGW